MLNVKQPSVSPMAAFLLPITLAGLLLSGCAGKEDVSWQQDKDLVSQSLQQVSENQAKSNDRSDLLDTRVRALEKTVAMQQSQLSALMASVENQQEKHRQLNEKVGVKAPAKTVSRSPKNIALSKKLDKIESSIATASEEAKPALVIDQKAEEKSRYTSAYLALKSGKYSEASTDFKVLINSYPEGEYTDQAAYWLGESLMAQGKFSDAIETFTNLTQSFPQSNKYQAGLLKLAMAYQADNRIGDAKAVLKRLIHESPESKTAENARLKLSELDSKSK